MLFTPKKYGKGYRLFLALSFLTGSLVFAIFAIAAIIGCIAFGDPSDRAFASITFALGMIAFGVVGVGQWRWYRQTPPD